MYAYKETYLNDAREQLGEMFDYAVNVYGMEPDSFWDLFVHSAIARGLSAGEARLIAGMSGYELFAGLLYECMQKRIEIETVSDIDKSVAYWAGWALAYYQWRSGMSYKAIRNCGIRLTEVLDLYILHEAPDEKFYEVMAEKMKVTHKGEFMKRLRAYHHLTQKELSDATGVSLRMVQLYEQGQNDLEKAQAGVALSLAEGLGTDVKELIR